MAPYAPMQGKKRPVVQNRGSCRTDGNGTGQLASLGKGGRSVRYRTGNCQAGNSIVGCRDGGQGLVGRANREWSSRSDADRVGGCRRWHREAAFCQAPDSGGERALKIGQSRGGRRLSCFLPACRRFWSRRRAMAPRPGRVGRRLGGRGLKASASRPASLFRQS